MKPYASMTEPEQYAQLIKEHKKYVRMCAMGLALDMSRGKPDRDQLNLSEEMLGILNSSEQCILDNGFDCRNYGLLDGIPEAKKMFSDLLDVPTENIIIGGNSSLNLMYDILSKALIYGVLPEYEPWMKQGDIKFLCPSPGYDRHFGMCQSLGIEMIRVPMTPTGPDMDVVERLVASDPMIKGIWCVPKYSNPTGITYSDETVRRMASLETAAPDFRIFWDDAYFVHDIYDEGDKLLNIREEAEKAGKPDIVYIFASTSKICFPGSGIAAIAASKRNINCISSIMAYQTIGYDKLNMLRHVLYFKNADGVRAHMKRHAELLRPKFDAVLSIFERELGGTGVCTWTKPKGGYFISFDITTGSARRVFELAWDAGVRLTSVGSTYPYGNDPHDRNLRIAPSFPPIKELITAAEVFCTCVKIAALERLTGFPAPAAKD